jgi:FkbM family methyltransferase
MRIPMRVRYWFGGHGLNRSLALRMLVRFGHTRIRQVRADAMETPGLRGAVMRRAVGSLEQGVLRVPQGYAGGLAFDMHHLPISHAHFGSIAFGNLESAVQEAMVRHLGRGDVFYDIGANIGFFSMLGAHLAGFDAGRVYAFEATPDNADAIRANARLNDIPNIRVLQRAVSSHAGRARLQVVDDQSWSKLEEYGSHPSTERVLTVDTVAIDDLVESGSIPPPTLVKIDVEGAEIAVLEGMRQTIDDHRPAIICELHDTHREFCELMEEHGYRLINLEGTIPVREEGASAHALALPPGNRGD